MGQGERKTPKFAVRIPTVLQKQLEQLAAKHSRTVTGEIEAAVRHWIRSAGLTPPDEVPSTVNPKKASKKAANG